MDVIGDVGCEPHGSAISAGDLVAGIEAGLGILIALHQRQRTGRGQRVDVAMANAIGALNERSVFSYNLTGEVPTRGWSARSRPSEPSRPGMHMSPLESSGRPSGTASAALSNGPIWPATPNLPTASPGPAISAWLQDKTKLAAATILCEAEVPAAPVLNAKEVSESEHYRSRRMLVEFESPGAGTVRVMGSPIKFGDDPEPPVRRPPILGEHTNAVLAGLAGLDRDQIAELRRQGGLG